MDNEITVAVVIAIAAMAAALLCGNAYSSYQCSNYQETTGKDTKWIFMDTCYIKTADGFERFDVYKARSIASEAGRNSNDN